MDRVVRVAQRWSLTHISYLQGLTVVPLFLGDSDIIREHERNVAELQSRMLFILCSVK